MGITSMPYVTQVDVILAATSSSASPQVAETSRAILTRVTKEFSSTHQHARYIEVTTNESEIISGAGVIVYDTIPGYPVRRDDNG